MNGLQKFLHKIGDFFTGLFNKAKHAWNNIEPLVQEALKQGSDVIYTINTNIDATPDFIWEELQKKWPGLTKEELHKYLLEATQGTAVASEIANQDLETTILALQRWLGSLEGKTWANISEALAKAYAAAKAPKETKFGAISALMQFVYHAFIKKN